MRSLLEIMYIMKVLYVKLEFGEIFIYRVLVH